jgi:hypothetical protein
MKVDAQQGINRHSRQLTLTPCMKWLLLRFNPFAGIIQYCEKEVKK